MKRFERHKSIGIAISAIYRSSTAQATEKLKEYGITSNQIPYLMLLAHRKNLSQDNLAKELMVDKANVARALQKLERIDMIKRERSEKDKRAYILSLTEKGENVLPICIKTFDSWFDTILSDLSEQDESCLAKALTKISNKIDILRGNNEKS